MQDANEKWGTAENGKQNHRAGRERETGNSGKRKAEPGTGKQGQPLKHKIANLAEVNLPLLLPSHSHPRLRPSRSLSAYFSPIRRCPPS